MLTLSNILYPSFSQQRKELREAWNEEDSLSWEHFLSASAIRDGDILISEFMGVLHTPFHLSWDLLMDVVERIETTGTSTIWDRPVYSSFTFSRYEVEIYFELDNVYLFNLHYRTKEGEIYRHPMYAVHCVRRFPFREEGKMAAVHTACVEFVLWYNEWYKD